MKKFAALILSGFVLILISSCSTLQQQQQQKNEIEQKEKYITKKSGYVVDMCAQENMPRFKYRPRRPTKDELAGLSDKEIAIRVTRYVDALEDHVEHLEKVIIDTRLRVERCK